MRLHQLKAVLKAALSGAAVLLLGVGSASAATPNVNVTAGTATAKLPDGSPVPMWGYTCDSTQPSSSPVTCSALNSTANGAWSPIVITVPTGTDLTIHLTNGLVFGGNQIPTSMVIVGQLGGGLGTPVTKAGPAHDNQGTTWPIANGGPIFTPPAQGPRVQSFGTEIAGNGSGDLTWSGLKPGTYLLESGTHPSIQATMGLVGMVVVTQAPASSAGVAYPSLGTRANYNAELPLLFSEIDPIQNAAVNAAVNTAMFSETATHGVSTSGPIQNINVTNGGAGYTTVPLVTISGGGIPTTPAQAHAVIDTDSTSPTFGQVTEIDLDNPGAGYSSTPSVSVAAPPAGPGHATATAASVLPLNPGSQCSGGASACYPSVVNYSPLYYLINGVAFDRTNSSASLFNAAPASGTNSLTGNVLVRMVNAGSRMHVPTIVGSRTTNPTSNTDSTPVTSNGFTLVAEDGNPLPGAPRIQSEIFMAAGKTYDVMIDAPAAGGTALPVFDRQGSLSANSISRDAGMLAYVGVNGNGVPTAASGTATAVADTYAAVKAGVTLTISDPAKGVIANDSNIYGVQKSADPLHGSVTVNNDGTFSYVPDTSWAAATTPTTTDSFSYCGNGATSGSACTTVTLNVSNIADVDGISVCGSAHICKYYSNVATGLVVKAPGLLDGATEGANLPVSVVPATITDSASGLTVTVNKDGSFTAFGAAGKTLEFDFDATNTLGAKVTGHVTVVFPTGSGLHVKVLDGTDHSEIASGYRWIIEEDRTFYVDPHCTTNPLPSDCPGASSGLVPNFGVNFHTSYMPVIASGCTDDLSCGNNQTALGLPVAPRPTSKPGDVAECGGGVTTGCLDPKKRYYISILPGDAAQPFIGGWAGAPQNCSGTGPMDSATCGHGMGGANIPSIPGGHRDSQTITVYTVPSPYPPATLSVFVFEDDYPLNGEHDAGGGIDVLSPNEAGLGGFQITLADDAGGTGDATGNPTYDMFNMPLSNSLAGTIDPVTGFDACPLSTQVTAASQSGDSSQNGIVGMIITCPTYESGKDAQGKPVLSPLAGQAVVKNLYQGRYGVIANAGADRIARGEEWLQTNTLDGQKAHDSFMRIGEPAYFQEFGPAGYHVTIGFANPKIISDRGKAICATTTCNFEVKGHISTARMSRPSDERLYGSGTHDSYSFTQSYVSLGDPDGADFLFAKCAPDGSFDFKNVPAGNWKITTFDQWNDQIVDGITTPVGLTAAPGDKLPCGGAGTTSTVCDMGEVAVHQWQSDIYTRSFVDTDYTGLSSDDKPGLALVDTNIRFRDGSFSNFNSTDLDGYAGFNEVFPLFNWYMIETDSTRYKNSGTHVVYDSGGPADNPKDPAAATGLNCSGANPTSKPCEKSNIGANMANTYEPNPLPPDLSVPGAVYCTLSMTADCLGQSIAGGPKPSDDSGAMSTGRIDPAWVNSYAWQGFLGQNNFLEFGKRPFADDENGGIHGHVVYASTRPFDDPQLLLQLSWEPLVPHVRMNLYKEGVASDGVTTTLTLVDHTETTSFDDWAQGFRQNPDGSFVKGSDGKYVPNMNCPGQGRDTSTIPDPYFWFTLQDQPQWLDLYNNGSVTHPISHDSQFKCFDGMHNWNQLQPAPYDGMYSFPSMAIDPTTGKPAKDASGNYVTNCTACVKNPTSDDPTMLRTDMNYDPYRAGTPMLPDGKYVVEMVVPEGFELVKEEDKNILIGDNFIAPVTQQFGGLGSVFIMPDQAEVANATNSLNSTQNLGRSTLPSHEADTGNVESFWPCVGADHIVPDYISLFPASQENAPFAGATRKLCDRKEVTLDKQSSVLAKFYVFTETHTASHFTGLVTDDFASEFDPFSPQFGEKFGPAYVPVAIKDWKGNEVSRVYSDEWGAYNGLNYSTWEVNPPNPTGYGPTMMVTCMNDAGPVPDGKGGTMNDPFFQEFYSQFCYELPFMPGQTGYFDTPVVPTSAFAGGYNNPDCAYPDATPAIKEVNGDGNFGPWVAGLKGTVTSIAVSDNGSGYTTVPAVTIDNTGTGGTGAAATAVIDGKVVEVKLTPATRNTNRGYTAAPVVGFTSGSGSGATAVANMTGSVTGIAITNGGVYPRTGVGSTVTVTISGGGATTNATGTVNFTNIGGFNGTTKRVSSVTITNAGAGYTSTPTVSFSSGAAAGTANMGLSVASLTLINPGTGYTSAPSVTFTGAVQAGGQAAAGTAVDAAIVVAVNVTNPGSGYASAPSVTIAAPPSGTTATATASIETTGTLTIKALGNQLVNNYQYSGPSASAAPFNQQKVTRHYGFGAAPTDFSSFTGSLCPTSGACSCSGGTSAQICPYVKIEDKPMVAVTWADGSITGQVPSGVPNCKLQQQAVYGGSTAQCGQLTITAPNGQQSVDTVTVTIGGKMPTYITDKAPLTASGIGAIQQAIDAAQPGDLLMVGPGVHSEMILMWKPVRLQGIGAASSVIDANPQPAGKLNPWRQRVVCLFGLALNGIPISGTNPYNPDSSPGAVSCPDNMKFSVDRLPLEATVGWDATLNGNLAEQLIEPTLMGAYEGAGITVLGKGVSFPAGSDPFASDAFPTGTTLLNGSTDATIGCGTGTGRNPNPSNFYCNPSSIDGLTVQNSSQGGGGIWVHAWGHDLQIANNRLMNNQGTMSGGLTVGQGEHPDVFLAQAGTATVPGSCIPDGNVTANLALPYCNNVDVNVHHNSITQNSSLGDELFSSTPAGAGGATFCNGSDYYKFNYNWVCGNMSTGDGAGVAHVGFIYDGDIEHNSILYNQSTNPTIVANGGGLLIMGAPDADPPCGLVTDQDCVSAPGTITPSDGTGPGLVINANLILGNSADSGSGGGLRLQHINGNDVLNFPNGNAAANWPSITGHALQPDFQRKTAWNAIQITNNIIANNVAGIDGGGVSLLDALATDIINNTIISNNSTATSGVLLQTLFAPLASTQGTNCTTNNGAQSCPQVAGLVSVTNSAVLTANIGTTPITCPANHGTFSATSTSNCLKFSVPVLYNNVFWQNRSVVIGVGAPASGFTNLQNTVTVYNPSFTNASAVAAGTQAKTGACDDPAAKYWDIGVRGDTAPGNHSGGVLAPQYSLLTNANEATAGANNRVGAAPLTATYCNGARVPVEAANAMVPGTGPYPGWLTTPGTNESNPLQPPPFTLQASATTDEGNNWINLRWGPLSLNLPNPVTGSTLINATPTQGTPTTSAVDEVPVIVTPAFNPYTAAPAIDFNGSQRKTADNLLVDAGAIEIVPTPRFSASLSPTTLAFGTVANGQTPTQTVTVTNTGNQTLTGGTFTFGGGTPQPFSQSGGTCVATLNAGATCTIIVRFTAVTGSFSRTLTVAYNNVSVTGSPVTLTGAGAPMVVNPASLSFGNVGVSTPATTTAAQTLTLRNGTGATRTVVLGAFPAGFSRATAAQGGAGSCGATLLNGAACTINVVFTPTVIQAYSGTLTITTDGGFTVANSPVSLSGAGVTPVRTASFLPATWNPVQTRNCPGLACTFGDPTQGFVLTNTGNVNLTGITRGTLSGANTADFNIVLLTSSCGPAGFPQLVGNTTLAPGATCTITVQFAPLTAEAAGTKTATISVTDVVGTQSAAITGQAN